MSLADPLKIRTRPFHDRTKPRRSQGESYHVQPQTDSKSFAKAAAEKDAPQPSYRRMHRDNISVYNSLMLEANALSGTTRPLPQPVERKVLERYQGFVVNVEGSWANVTLMTDQGEEFAGTYPTAELAAQGIGERDRFILETIDRGATVKFDIKLIPRRVVSPAEQHAIREAIVRELGDYSPGNDY